MERSEVQGPCTAQDRQVPGTRQQLGALAASSFLKATPEAQS